MKKLRPGGCRSSWGELSTLGVSPSSENSPQHPGLYHVTTQPSLIGPSEPIRSSSGIAEQEEASYLTCYQIVTFCHVWLLRHLLSPLL